MNGIVDTVHLENRALFGTYMAMCSFWRGGRTVSHEHYEGDAELLLLAGVPHLPRTLPEDDEWVADGDESLSAVYHDDAVARAGARGDGPRQTGLQHGRSQRGLSGANQRSDLSVLARRGHRQ
eukprot:3005592-Rhodomonas_salina.3